MSVFDDEKGADQGYKVYEPHAKAVAALDAEAKRRGLTSFRTVQGYLLSFGGRLIYSIPVDSVAGTADSPEPDLEAVRLAVQTAADTLASEDDYRLTHHNET